MKRKRYIKLIMSRYPWIGRDGAAKAAEIVRLFAERGKQTIEVNGAVYNSRGYAFYWAAENCRRYEDAAMMAEHPVSGG